MHLRSPTKAISLPSGEYWGRACSILHSGMSGSSLIMVAEAKSSSLSEAMVAL